jgi:hypothetical protein
VENDARHDTARRLSRVMRAWKNMCRNQHGHTCFGLWGRELGGAFDTAALIGMLLEIFIGQLYL